MTQSTATHLQCPVVVLTITQNQIQGDEIADAMRDQMLAVAVQAQAHSVILDFQHVRFLSSSGFRPLLSLHRVLRQHSGRLLLCGLSPEVHEIFEVTRLITSKGAPKAPFEVYPDVVSAVTGLFQSEAAPASE